MTKEQEVLSEKILDNLFYTWYDKIASEDSDEDSDDVFDEMVADAEEALANESDNIIKSLNFR